MASKEEIISELKDEIEELKVKKMRIVTWIMKHPQSDPDEYMQMLFAQSSAMDAYKFVLELRIKYLKGHQEAKELED